ncbi:MAG: gene transfer agent family protein [Nitratireductor sp.]|nr:gene transfer agent family protein [Nitratireductor sp.]
MGQQLANTHRGEIAAGFEGRQWTLCLTLGGLAELESHFGASGLSDLTEKLAARPLAARDLIAILTAGLRGGGHDLTAEDVAELRHEKGTAGFASVAAELLQATFAVPAIEPEGGSRGG